MKRRDFGMMSEDTTSNLHIFGDSDSEEEFILAMAQFIEPEMNISSCSDDIDDSSDSDEDTGIDFGTAASGKCFFCLFI